MSVSTSRYWLDNLFDYTNTNENNNKKEMTLEEQFNSLSKLAILSFFVFICFYDIQKSLTLVISILFLISVSFYFTQKLIEKREHFDEIYEYPSTNKRTNVNDLNINVVIDGDHSKNSKHSRDIYLQKRDSNTTSSKYKTITPLHNFFEKDEKKTFVHPSLLTKIDQRNHIYHDDWKEKPINIRKKEYSEPKRQLLSTDNIFFRSNINNDSYHNHTKSETDQKDINSSISEDFLQSRLQMSDNYRDILDKKTFHRREQQRLAPINLNSRYVSGFGGKQSSSSYLGPR